MHLIKRIDGPRTDITDTTECFYATVDDSHHRIGDLVEIRNALNHSTQVNKYDQHGRPTEIVDANGAVTTLTYPPRGWLTARTVDGQTTAFEYDDVGQLDRVTLPDGSYLDYDYDDARRLISIRDNANNQIAYELDTFGNRITETTFDPSATIVRQLDRVYDALNRLSKLVAGEGQTTAFQYDTNGNLITTIDPRDPFPDPANQNPQIFASNLYDALNRVRQTTDAKGGVTSFTYDVNDNVKGVVDPEGFVTAYTYNGFGELVRLVSPDTGQTDYLFDEAGNRTSTDDARPVGAIAYTYDELNRLISIDFPNDVDTVYGYDDTSVGTGCTSPRNAIGRLTSLSDESGSTDYFYDLRGNITCKERTIAGEAFIIRYTYDSADRIETLTYPSGQVVAYERNAAGQIHRMTTTFDSVTKTIVENIEHAPFGWPTAWQFGNQLQADLPIDLSYRTTSITHGAALDLSFGYDAADNIESITNVVAAGDSEAFQYDGNSRLIEAIGPYGEFDYAYDANGNRTSYIVDDDPAGTRSTTYTYYPNTNRLHENIAGSTYLSFDRDYDESGNTISRIPQYRKCFLSV